MLSCSKRSHVTISCDVLIMYVVLTETCKPYTLSYSECVDENLNIMNITKTPPIGVEGCTNVTEEIPCVSTQTSSKLATKLWTTINAICETLITIKTY